MRLTIAIESALRDDNYISRNRKQLQSLYREAASVVKSDIEAPITKPDNKIPTLDD
jgi:hypothetical protein